MSKGHLYELEQQGALRGSIWRRGVVQRLARLSEGLLVIEDDLGEVRVGHPATDKLAGRILVRDPGFWRRVALGGSLGAAESFAEAEWAADDLTSVIRLFARNRTALASVESVRAEGPTPS